MAFVYQGRPQIAWSTRYLPHVPQPKQHAYLWLDGMEALYGGAAGGGKSDALLMAALQFIEVPGYSALLLRKTYPELTMPGGLIFRSHEWLAKTDARWNENEKRWKFPNGSTLDFGYLKTEQDKLRYQGAEYQFIGFDELTQFRQADYIYLFSRLRRLAGSRVPIRMRAATNPGGPGHRWVRDRFILKKPTDDTALEAAKAQARIFIPARLSDNEYIDRDLYELALSELDEYTRAQLLDGDWNARQPGNWMIDHRHIDAMVDRGRAMRAMFLDYMTTGDYNAFPPPVGGTVDLGIDWGEHTQGYVIWPLERGGVYVPETEPESVQEHGEPGLFAEKFIPKVLDLGYPVRSARYDAAGIQSMRTFGRTVRANFDDLRELRTVAVPFNKFKRETINYERLLGRRTVDNYTTRIMAIDPMNDRLIDQLYGWERKDEESEEAVKEDDHGPDALVAGIAPIARKHREQQLEMIQKAKTQRRQKEAVTR